jgi:MFS family permease
MRGTAKGLMPLLLVSELLMWTLYGNISTFFPPYIKEHHSTITDPMVGVILALFEGGMLITSPITSVLLSKVGRKNFILIGTFSMIIASAGFGLLVYIDDDLTFFLISIGLRIFQGFGEAAANTAISSIIGSEYPDKRDVYFGYLESSIGAGLMLGPVLGQVIYTFFGF